MRCLNILFFILMCIIFKGCQQEISIKNAKFTAINPVSYTDVIYKSSIDTVLVSTFDGKIYELIKEQPERKLIAQVQDEIYDLIYNPENNHIYAATLDSGIMIFNADNGKIIQSLPIQNSWVKKLTFNQKSGILACYDVKGNPYLWNIHENFHPIEIPKSLDQFLPQFIDDKGEIYGKQNLEIIKLNAKNQFITSLNQTKDQIVKVDEKQNFLMFSGKEFKIYNSHTDSILWENKHPDWPIYVAEKDTLIHVPMSLEIQDLKMNKSQIFTLGLDKSLRIWNKENGNLIKTHPNIKATPSAMDLNQENNQIVIVDLLGNIEFWNF